MIKKKAPYMWIISKAVQKGVIDSVEGAYLTSLCIAGAKVYETRAKTANDDGNKAIQTVLNGYLTQFWVPLVCLYGWILTLSVFVFKFKNERARTDKLAD